MFSSVFLNRWNKNYWGEDYHIVKIIPGDPCNVIDWNPAKEPYDIDIEKIPTPKCNTKWFFFCNINTSGFVNNAYEFLQGIFNHETVSQRVEKQR